MTLLDRIREAVSVPFLQSDQSILISLHQDALSLAGICPVCPSRFEDAYYALKVYLKKEETMKKNPTPERRNPKYTLKKEHENIYLALPALGENLTRDTMSDRLAEYVIHNIPELKDIFEIAE